MNRTLLSTGKNDWETPQDFFDELNKEFHFTLDPCASENNHKCEKYFTEKENGLLQDWSGERVYCNPPYSAKEQDAWVKKCYEESKHATVVMLVPARTDTERFHKYILPHAEIRFLKGRLTFVGAKDPAPFPNMVVIFRPEVVVLDKYLNIPAVNGTLPDSWWN